MSWEFWFCFVVFVFFQAVKVFQLDAIEGRLIYIEKEITKNRKAINDPDWRRDGN